MGDDVHPSVNFSIERFIKRLKQHDAKHYSRRNFSIERFIKRLKQKACYS